MVDLLQKPQIICHTQKSLDYAIHDVKWIPCSAKFIAVGGKSNGAGIVEIYALTGEGVEKRGEFCKKEHFKCATFDASSLRNRHLATGDFAGRLQVWDLEDNLVPIYKTTEHKAVINAIDGVSGAMSGCGAPEIVTGSRDGKILEVLWYGIFVKKILPVAKFLATEGTTGRDCWAVAFGNTYNNEERVVAAGYDNGDIKIFDLNTMKVRWSKCVKNGWGFSLTEKNIPMNKLVATTLESKIHCFDVKTYHPKKGISMCNRKSTQFDNLDGKTLAAKPRDIYDDRRFRNSVPLEIVRILYTISIIQSDGWKKTDEIPYGVAGELTMLQNTVVSEQPVTSFDWCADKMGLSVCSSYDQSIRVLITTKLKYH
ncbi:hypothetical protein NQ317_004721 [Molorchus minor]|uniref:WD repeat-containing protein 92 n=1 Tax=Molorchus minor TaxID=1323400 RepID=A0ABQ9JQ90_9CUCU|nr:hypothetical protein NQ317_004721 [Molorchus minor]